MEEQMILEVWETLSEYIPQKKREEAAMKYIKVLEDYVTYDSDEVAENDTHLESAIELLYGEE